MEHLLWAHLWSSSEDTASSHKMLFSRTGFSCMLWISLLCMTFNFLNLSILPDPFGQLTNIYWVTPAHLTLYQGMGDFFFKAYTLPLKSLESQDQRIWNNKMEQQRTLLHRVTSSGTDEKERKCGGRGVESLLAGLVRVGLGADWCICIVSWALIMCWILHQVHYVSVCVFVYVCVCVCVCVYSFISYSPRLCALGDLILYLPRKKPMLRKIK